MPLNQSVARRDLRWERVINLLVNELGNWPKQNDNIRPHLFSTRVIRLLRAESREEIKIGWGHIFDQSSKITKSECDIIVFTGDPVCESDFNTLDSHDLPKGKGYGKEFYWKHPILNAYLVEKSNIKLIIECKSLIRLDKKNKKIQNQADLRKQYETRKNLVNCEVWLIAEKVLAKTTEEINKIETMIESNQMADRFYNFYNDIGDQAEYNETKWHEFMDKIAQIS